LNVKAGKIIHTTVNNVHFDKLLGVSAITPETAKRFCKKYFPKDYEQFSKEMDEHPETLYLDFENIWTRLEESLGYQTLLQVIKKQKIEVREEKVNIALFIAVQNIRSHALIRSMIEFSEESGAPKFEYYWKLKHMLANPDFLYGLTAPLLFSQWIIYLTDEHTFPLPDTPIFVKNQNVMVALSPRMLLEIDLKVPAPEYSWIHKEEVPISKLDEYQKRCISNAFKEIIFDRRNLLETWMNQLEFKQRVKLMSEQKSFNIMVKKEGSRELWKINAFSNLENYRSKRRRQHKSK
jgi:hypothetical protein